MVEKWAANVFAELKLLGITQREFAKECGYSEEYVCQVLRGKRYTPQAKETITETLRRLKAEA